jgi:hypothetical protein
MTLNTKKAVPKDLIDSLLVDYKKPEDLIGPIDDIVISIVVFLVVSLRNTDGTVIQGANSVRKCVNFKIN